jgi:hypothetical protein
VKCHFPPGLSEERLCFDARREDARSRRPEDAFVSVPAEQVEDEVARMYLDPAADQGSYRDVRETRHGSDT